MANLVGGIFQRQHEKWHEDGKKKIFNFQLPHRRQGPLPYFGWFFFRRKTIRNLELRRFGECGEELPRGNDILLSVLLIFYIFLNNK